MRIWTQAHRIVITAILLCASIAHGALEDGWNNPPTEARLRAYWWWLNGNVTKASITRDLEEMKAKGFGGAVLVDAGGAQQEGNDTVPHGPTFFSREWRELYKFTLQEASRLGLEISLNILSGWNLGGPVVSQEDAVKKYVYTETEFSGGARIKLPQPKTRDKFYRDVAVVGYRIIEKPEHPPLENWKQKALQASLPSFSCPDSSSLFAETKSTPGEQDASAQDVIDLTKKMDAKGGLHWQPPAGKWEIFRFGYTIADHDHVSTSSDDWTGYALDVYSAEAFNHYWNAIVEPLIADAGPLAGKTLKYLYTDSWEIELANWTPKFLAEFQSRNGYDMRPWLPVLAGRIINSRAESDRFLFDYRKTLGDLTIDHHYRLFSDGAHRRGLGIHPESGGPHAVPIDAQRCLGMDDAPMSEFWASAREHRVSDQDRFFVKQPASAAHTYGRKLVMAESFTTLGPHWQEAIQDNLKPNFDKALCEGMNLVVWHAFVCSPDSTGIPGQQYFAGTHLNPKVTWWSKSAPFFSYIDRCQWMMQQGKPVSDVLYYYGDHVPNFAQLKQSDPAHVLPGYDYDVITAEALIERARVDHGNIVLPDGVTYRELVLPERDQISLPVLKKIQALVDAGATVIGPKPLHAESLSNKTAADAEMTAIAAKLWNGHVITRQTAREALRDRHVLPDCEFLGDGDFDYIHREDGDTDIYFVAHRTNTPASTTVAFRITGKAPEIWDAVTGEHHFATTYEEKDGRTWVPVEFAPCGSMFIVFRAPSAEHLATGTGNNQGFSVQQTITGPWSVHFDPKWGGPKSVSFDQLGSWTERSEPGVKYYSGTAMYEKTMEMPGFDGQSRLYLDLGNVRELAEVKVNGKSYGILWCPPWRVDISGALHLGANDLKIEVVNFWPNRIIGDATFPDGPHYTKTNIRKLTAETPLMESGLLGPVKILQMNPAGKFSRLNR